ncbi:hypothetical protein MUK42_37098 [Musa troglodytarum]|uniref:Uncharacterized protein n=1 Tax=Musa troglodytarum TaxID=320322 RepID=A0A9E7G9H3_9LILI|nr:hypothetical protein MUK42_37098 [Musa troglodytarum]
MTRDAVVLSPSACPDSSPTAHRRFCGPFGGSDYPIEILQVRRFRWSFRRKLGALWMDPGLELRNLVLDITTTILIGSQIHPCKRVLNGDEDGRSAGPEDREGLHNNAMHHKAKQGGGSMCED